MICAGRINTMFIGDDLPELKNGKDTNLTLWTSTQKDSKPDIYMIIDMQIVVLFDYDNQVWGNSNIFFFCNSNR